MMIKIKPFTSVEILSLIGFFLSFSICGLTNAQINIIGCGPPHADCATSPCNGHTHLCVTGGTPPYTYLWSPTGQTTLNITGMCPGQYTLTVTDAIGTTATGGGVGFSQVMTVSCSANPPTITAGNSATLTATISGAAPPYTYFWSAFSTINPIVVSPTTTTCYSVTVVDVNGCTDTSSVCITVNPAGINEYIKDNSITISPNPFYTQTILQADNFFKNATLIVYNSCGQTVKQIKNISGQTVTLSRDNLPSGLYCIRLVQDDKVFVTEKIIITDN